MASYTYTVSASYGSTNYLWSGHGLYNSPDPTIYLTEGDDLTIINISGGHAMQIDGTGFNITESGGQISITNISVQTYTYRCTAHPVQMQGQIIVSTASTGSSGSSSGSSGSGSSSGSSSSGSSSGSSSSGSSSGSSGSGSSASAGSSKKINELNVTSTAIDPNRDKLLVESEGSCHSISMKSISKILDIRRREANKTQWTFIPKENTEDSLPIKELTENYGSTSANYPITLPPGESKAITVQIAGRIGVDPPTDCKRVMVFAKAKNIILETRFRSQTITSFEVRKSSLVLFIIENIQDVQVPVAKIPLEEDGRFLFIDSGLQHTGGSDALRAQAYYLNLKDSERKKIIGPIMDNPNLLPQYIDGGQDINLDPRNEVTLKISNPSKNETGYINSIRPIAWSY